MPSLTPAQQLALARLMAARARSSPANGALQNFGRQQGTNIGSRFAQDLFRNQAGQLGNTLLPESLRGISSTLNNSVGQITPYLPYLQAIRAKDPGMAAVNLVGQTAVRAAAQQAAAAGTAGAAGAAAGGMPSFMGMNPVTALFAVGQLADAYDARKEAQRVSRDLGRWSQDQEATGGEYAMPWIHLDKLATNQNSELRRQIEALYGSYSPEEMAAVAGRDTVDAMRARTAMDENQWNGTQEELDNGMQQRFRSQLMYEMYNQYLNAFREGKTDVFGNPIEGSGFSYQRPQAAQYRGGPVTGDNLSENVGRNMYTGVWDEQMRDLRAGGWFNPTYADPSSPLGGGADNQYYSYRRGTTPMAIDPAEAERRAREATNRAAFGNFTPVTSTTPAPQPAAQPPAQPTEPFGRNVSGRYDTNFAMESQETPWYLAGQGA
jgi:hypothetical protein